MPKGERKTCTKEFKLSAVYMMMSKTYRPKEVFQMLNVDRQTVYRWVQEFKQHGELAFDTRAVLPGEEVRRLQKELEDLRMENEILKKPRHTSRNDTRKNNLFSSGAWRVSRTQSMPNLTNTTLRLLRDMRRNGVRRKASKEEEMRAVEEAFLDHHGSFGRRILKKLMEERSVCISERKISKIMKELGLRSKYGRKKSKNVYTSESTEKYIHDNQFARLTPGELEKIEVWSMDFTEEKIKGKKIYTCGIISVKKKILVGYSQGKSCTALLAIEALTKAVATYGKPDMVMTDRGAQFTSKAFYDILEALSVRHSMSRPHKPIENRFIETFWKSMKVELGKTTLLTEQTYRMVVDYYVYYYNTLRPHSALGYKPPLAA